MSTKTEEAISHDAGDLNATVPEDNEVKQEHATAEEVTCQKNNGMMASAEKELETMTETWRKLKIINSKVYSGHGDDLLPANNGKTTTKEKDALRIIISDVKKPPRSPAISAVSREVNCSGKVKRKVKMHDGDGSHSEDGVMETDGNSITNIDRSVNGDTGSKSADAKIAGLKQSHSVAGRLWSLDVSLKELELGCDSPVENGNGNAASVRMMKEAWERLNKAYVYCNAKPVGMVAVSDPCADARNYNQVFIRDFVPCGLACMMMESKADLEVVESFLKTTLRLQWNSNKKFDNYKQGIATMPASFRVTSKHPSGQAVLSGFGDNIGRVPPTDSGFWWIILLRAYTQRVGNQNLSNLADFQKGIKDILNLCLVDGLDSSPTLLCADGCCMIDRRMGMYGYPIEIQALFFFALRCAKELLIKSEDCKELISRIDRRIAALSFHIQTYYWLDFERLNKIYRYKTEEYSQTTLNKFNVNPDSIPSWIFDFMSLRGGYFIGNVSPSRKDLRWFSVGNCIAILCSLATPEQANAIMDLVEAHWEDLIGEMPMKIAYPALKEYEWEIITGCDPKNTAWSNHNAGSWPVLVWLITAASIKTGRPHIGKKVIQVTEERLGKDGWPEYYDGKRGRFVGKQARKYQTWSVAGYLVAKLLMENPSNIRLVSFPQEEDKKITRPRLIRSTSCPPFTSS